MISSMKLRAPLVGFWIGILIVAFTGCSSVKREPQKQKVAILVSIPGLNRAPTPEEMASIRSVLQPEIESRGYAVADKPHQADYIVQVTNLSNPMGRRLTLERVPYRDSAARNPDSRDTRLLSERVGMGTSQSLPQEPSRETRK